MYESERESMVRYQLEKRGITDRRVLNAMCEIERHLFVNKEDELYAYEDRPLTIGSGQTISQPYMVALMTQTLHLTGSEKVLEIGTGSGYQTAILAKLSKQVFTIERLPELVIKARQILKLIKFDNVKFNTGDGTMGWIDESPFERIIVTAAAPRLPQLLIDQLNIGGRMVIPIGGRYSQELHLIVKQNNGMVKLHHRGGCVFVPLIGKEGWSD